MRSNSTLTMGSGAMLSGHLSRAGRYASTRAELSSALEDRSSLKHVLIKFGKSFRDKLYLASYDILSVNLSSRPLYQLYQVLDFLFIAAYPINHIYNFSLSAKEYYTTNADGVVTEGALKAPFLQYLIPTNALFDSMPYNTNLQIAFCLIAFIFVVALILIALVSSRRTKRLATDTPERKLVNKTVGLIISVTYYLIFVPVTTFSSRFLICDDTLRKQLNGGCYQGSHTVVFVFVVGALLLHLFLIMYSSTMLTTCYPNENIPWAHFPSAVPFYKLAIRFPIVIVYQLDSDFRSSLLYFNAVFTLLMVAFIYFRITRATTFDPRIHSINLLSETILLVLFSTAFLCDLLQKVPLEILFTSTLVLTILGACFFVTKIQGMFNEYFVVSRVDIFENTSESDALRMMISLHRLIERSQGHEREEFILRGFVERHIEICDYPYCNCLDYYKVIGSSYRIGRATVASMKEETTKNMMSGQISNNQTHRTNEGESEDDLSMAGAQNYFYSGATGTNGKQNKAKTKFMNTFLINNIKVFIELFPGSLKLRYMSAFIYFNLFKNSFKALYELSYNNSLLSSNKQISGSTSLSFVCLCGKGGDAYNSYTLGLRIIEDFGNRMNNVFHRERNMGDMEGNLQQIIEFEKLNIKYQKSIEKTSEITERFWMELSKKGGLNIDTIFNIGATINQRFHSIKRKYKRLMSINQNYLEVAYLYKLFVQLCLNFELEESEAKLEITKILQLKGMRKRNLRQEYSKINFSDENGMIIISGCQSNFSNILAMNNKAERIFGYSTAELIDQPLLKLQPMVYSSPTPQQWSAHDDFIMNYINNQSVRAIKKEKHRFVWGKHKSGFIMPIVMDISAYVTFEHNLCFIAFCKRSILLEMTPLKEIIDAQDVFVLLADNRGVITDMTRNVTDWLGFPQSALQKKEICLEKVFEGIMDDDKEFEVGKRIDFFMNSFKDAMDDYENRSDAEGDQSGEGGAEDLDSTLYMKDKKCRALVWMKIHDYPLVGAAGMNLTGEAQTPPGSGYISFGGVGSGGPTQELGNVLRAREIWFVLLEEEAATATATASILDSKNTHDTGLAGVLEKEELKFTYQEDREEISSLASISSLAGYNNTDKGLINKLSEIKTSTVEDQKPRSISLLQQALAIVFCISVVSALIMLSMALMKNTRFYQDLQLMNSSKLAVTKYQNMQIMMRELVSLANGEQPEFTLFPLPQAFTNITGRMPDARQSGNSIFMQAQILQQAEAYRLLLLEVDNPTLKGAFDSVQMNTLFKEERVMLNYIRKDGLIIRDDKSFLLSIYEFLTACLSIGQAPDYRLLSVKREALNSYMDSGAAISPYLVNMTNLQREVFFFLNNSHTEALNYYPMRMAEFFIQQSKDSIESNSQAFLIITVLTIIITMCTALLVIPIIIRFESNKERVFFIYAELSRNDIDDRKRNIRVFFAKLRQSTMNPGGSLFYEKSSRIASSKLITRRFSANEPTAGGGGGQFGASGSGPGLSKNSGGGGGGFGGLVRQSAKSMGGQNSMAQDKSRRQNPQNFASLLNPDVNVEDYEEDLQAEMMKQKEEHEAAAFQRFFHGRIKAMGRLKKAKHAALVFVIAGLVQGYFLLKREMVTDLQNIVGQSINYYETISARDELFSQLLSEQRESLSRNITFGVPAYMNANFTSSVDYFLEQTLDNAKDFGKLRQSFPGVLDSTSALINELESSLLCNVSMRGESSISDRSAEACLSALDGILKTGISQTINTAVKEIIQSQIAFERLRGDEAGIRQLMNNPKIRAIIFLKVTYLDTALEQLLASIKTSLILYIQVQERSLIIFFACFIILLLAGVSVMGTFGMNFLYRNFNATKSILNFIPWKCLLELSDKTELKKIQF